MQLQVVIKKIITGAGVVYLLVLRFKIWLKFKQKSHLNLRSLSLRPWHPAWIMHGYLFT